jgi:hypothetical protein
MPVHVGPRARAALVLVLGLGLGLIGAPFAAAADSPSGPTFDGVPTVTTVDASPNPAPAGTAVTLIARVEPNPGGGAVVWSDAMDGDAEIGESEVDPTSGVATLVVTLDPGFHGVVATFRGSSGFASSAGGPLLVTVLTEGEPTTTALEAAAPATELGLEVVLTAKVSPPIFGFVAFTDGITLLALESVDPDSGVATLVNSRLRVGSHRVVATFLGDDDYAASQSAPLAIEVTTPSTIHASGLGLSRSSFYPVKDDYLDTVAIRGRVGQPAVLTAEVYSRATGKKVRSLRFGEKVGSYNVTWNGRDAAGALLPAGGYRIVQRLRDAWGNTMAHTSLVQISLKRLHWTTASQTRRGGSADKRQAYASALILRSRFVGGIQLDAGSGGSSPLDPSEAWVDYSFRLPDAAVYKTVTCGVLGATDPGRGPASILFRDWTAGDDMWDVIAEAKEGYAWTYGKGNPEDHISRTHEAICSIDVLADNGGQIDVASVKLTYTYGVLR